MAGGGCSYLGHKTVAEDGGHGSRHAVNGIPCLGTPPVQHSSIARGHRPRLSSPRGQRPSRGRAVMRRSSSRARVSDTSGGAADVRPAVGGGTAGGGVDAGAGAHRAVHPRGASCLRPPPPTPTSPHGGGCMELKHLLYRGWLQESYLWHQVILVVKGIGIHTKKRNRLTTARLEKLVYVQFNNRLITKRAQIKSKKITDVLLSSDATEAQGFLQEGGDDCALVFFRDEEDEDEMEGTGIPWSLIGEAVGAEQELESRSSARLRELYEGEEFESEDEEYDDENYSEDEI